MTRQDHIRRARYFRIGATIINVETGAETTYESNRVTFTPHSRLRADFMGNSVLRMHPYRRVVHPDKVPSISAAKRAARGMSGLVAEKPGENLRRIFMSRVVRP